MKILFVAPWVPSRVRPRSFGLLAQLAKSHDVWFVGLANRNDILNDLDELDLAGTTLVPTNRASATIRALARIPRRGSLQQAFAAEPAMRRAVRRLTSEWRPDVLHFNVIRSAGYLPPPKVAVPTVMDLDEIRSDYYGYLSRHGMTLGTRLLGFMETGRMRAAEQRAIERSAVVLVSSPVDLERSGSKGFLVRSPQFVRVERCPDVSPKLLFVGRMSYSANITAAETFARVVMPEVRRANPGATLTIVGENPTRRVKALAGDGVDVTGFVPDVSPYYAGASIAIVPVSAATGVQMKLIQALAAGVPTVATRAAAARAGVEAETHVLVADSDDEWIAAVNRLLADASLRAFLAENASAWARDQYSSHAISEALGLAYAAAASGICHLRPQTVPSSSE